MATIELVHTPTELVEHTVYTCSWCERYARYVGSGQDGDFYCPRHVHKAPGSVEEV